jgi:hypothetical protein
MLRTIRPKLEFVISVCNGCISYLLQRYDRNLFITSEPLSTVRKLKNDLLLCNDVLKRCREVHNPQLIADSILMLLKEINQCVMHEIYQDIVKLDLKEDIRHLKVQIRQLIVRLSPLNFDFIKKLFYLLNKSGIDEQSRWQEVSKDSINKFIVSVLYDKYRAEGKTGFKEEFVTAGGVDLKEVDFKTFESKLFPGLFFAGEVLNIDAITGGFNFQADWTGGWIAGEAMARLE